MDRKKWFMVIIICLSAIVAFVVIGKYTGLFALDAPGRQDGNGNGQFGAPYLYPIPEPSEDGVVILSWSEVYDADEYRIYRDDSRIGTAEITTFVDIVPMVHERTYYYYVKAVCWVDNAVSPKSNTESVMVALLPTTPALHTIPSPDNDGIYSVDWDASNYVDDYELWQKDPYHDDFQLLAENIDLLTYDEVVYDEGTYHYKVRAHSEYGYSEFSNEVFVVVHFTEVPETPTVLPITPATDTDGNIVLQWNAASGATSYNIHRKISGESYILIVTDYESLTYYDNGLTNGTYYYKIEAVNDYGVSEYSNEVIVTVSIYEPTPPPLPPPEPLSPEVIIIIVIVGIALIAVVIVIIKVRKYKSQKTIKR